LHKRTKHTEQCNGLLASIAPDQVPNDQHKQEQAEEGCREKGWEDGLGSWVMGEWREQSGGARWIRRLHEGARGQSKAGVELSEQKVREQLDGGSVHCRSHLCSHASESLPPDLPSWCASRLAPATSTCLAVWSWGGRTCGLDISNSAGLQNTPPTWRIGVT
jgi:hypothetical protein